MSSMDGLKRRIEAGEYRVDAHDVAGAIMDKLALIKRGRREIERAEAEEGTKEPARGLRRRGGRGATSEKRSGRRAANGRS
jgi:hypothetical protein